MNGTIAITLVIVLLMGITIILPRLLIKRSGKYVIQIFRANNAITISNAKTPEELGLKSKTITQKLLRPRDYKTYALQMLVNANVIKTTNDGKLFLSEEQLASSKWSQD